MIADTKCLTHFMVDDGRVAAACSWQLRMREERLHFFLSPMQGNFGGEILPFGLRQETKDFLCAEIEELHPQLLLRFEELAFTGMACSAGYDRFCLRDTMITPCMNSNVILGCVDDIDRFQPFDRSASCTAVHARAQCLPDAFISECRSHCMGDHRLPSSPSFVQGHAARFEEFWRDVVEPARRVLAADAASRIAAAVRSVAGPVTLAVFGVSAWPLLRLVGDLTTVDDVDYQRGVLSAGIRTLDPQDPDGYPSGPKGGRRDPQRSRRRGRAPLSGQSDGPRRPRIGRTERRRYCSRLSAAIASDQLDESRFAGHV